MNVSSVSMSQSLYSNKKKSKSDLFHASFYLSETPETPWNSNMVGKVQSGTYIVRNSNGSVSLSEVSFDDNGMLVLTPHNSQNGFIMRFRKMTDEEISDVKTAKNVIGGLNKIKRIAVKGGTRQVRKELYWIPLFIAFFLLLLEWMISERIPYSREQDHWLKRI